MKQLKTRNLAIAAVVLAALVASVTVSCSTKSSPTAPATGGPSGSGTPSPSGNFVVTMSANPTVLNADPTTGAFPASTITITVRSTSGAVPPNGSVAIVTVSPSAAGTLLDSQLCNAGTPGRYCIPLSGGRAQVLFAPSGSVTGTVVITAQFSDGAAQTAITINGPPGPTPTPSPTPVPPVFHIDSISPNIGDPSGGQHVTITGATFIAPVKVDFGGTSATVLSVAPDHIVVTVPPLAGGVPVGQTQAVTVTVTNAFGSFEQATDSLVNGFIYSNGGSIQQPQVFSITPTTGPQTGNTPITINGSNFQAPVQVKFNLNGVVQLEAATNNVTPKQIVALTPDITQYVASGALTTPVAATISVVNLNSGFSTTASQQFFYGQTMRITSISPGQGSFLGGDLVTIYGSGFEEPVAVSIGGIGQQVVSVAGDQVVIHTVGPLNPPACGQTFQGPVVVTNVEGGATASGPSFIFIGPQSPVLLSVAPTSGNVGTNVTITGNNLPGPGNTRVLFGGADGSVATIVSQTTSTITVTVPTPPAGFTFTTQTCSVPNVGTGTQQLPTPISITVRNLTTGCEGTLSNAFTVNPPVVGCTVTTPFPTPTPTPTPTPGP